MININVCLSQGMSIYFSIKNLNFMNLVWSLIKFRLPVWSLLSKTCLRKCCHIIIQGFICRHFENMLKVSCWLGWINQWNLDKVGSKNIITSITSTSSTRFFYQSLLVNLFYIINFRVCLWPHFLQHVKIYIVIIYFTFCDSFIECWLGLTN